MEEYLKKYLRPTFFCESDSKEIKNLAREIINRSKERDLCRAIFEWVRDNIEYDFSFVLASAKDYAKKRIKIGNCFNKNNLFIALCRSVGIPARYAIVRIKFVVDNKSYSLGHVVSEIYYKKTWRIVDVSFGKTSKTIKIKHTSKFRKIHMKPYLRLKEINIIFLILLFLADKISIKLRNLKNYLRRVPYVSVTMSE